MPNTTGLAIRKARQMLGSILGLGAWTSNFSMWHYCPTFFSAHLVWLFEGSGGN
jgi:hypothetical protein